MRRAPERQDRVVTREKAACHDCDWTLFRPTYAKSSGGLSAACIAHTRRKGHRTWIEVTAVTNYVPCVTIRNENGSNKEEDLPSDSGSSERNDVASMGGVRPNDAVVRWGADGEGTCVLAEEVSTDEEDV